MDYIKEKVAYLRGLADGMKLDDSTDERRLLKAIIDVLDDVALAVDDIEEVQEQLSEQVDFIDEDLTEIERVLFEEEEDDDDVLGEFECPHCNDLIAISEDMFDDEGSVIICPSCGKEIEIEWECECEDCSDKE